VWRGATPATINFATEDERNLAHANEATSTGLSEQGNERRR